MSGQAQTPPPMGLATGDGLSPAVFLDRDGTLIEDRGDLGDPRDAVFFADTAEALRRLQGQAKLFIVTNQSGVGKGAITAEQAARVNASVVERLRLQGVRIEEVYCCTHRREEQCRCAKPEPHFLLQAAREHGVDLRRSFVVGDHPSDVALALRAGARGVYVLTGHGAKHRRDVPAEGVVLPGIREAAEWVLAWHEAWRLEREQPGRLKRAAGLLRQGGVVAFPTETVYGLGAAAFDERAVARVFEIKRRPHFDPLIVHVSDGAQLARVAASVPAAAQVLMEQCWPGPLTLVLPKSAGVPDLVTAGLPTVAVRMPRHPLALELIREVGAPLAAPSANPFGRTSPTTAQHVTSQLGGLVDCVLDGGSCSVGIESTIVSLCGSRPTLLRPGGVPVETVEALVGPVSRPGRLGEGAPLAPGMLHLHYAPHTRLQLARAAEPQALHAGGRAGLISLKRTARARDFAAVELLSETGDLREAAANLFSAMRRLDEGGLDLIVAELVPEVGLGRAINDRLRRAAGAGSQDVL